MKITTPVRGTGTVITRTASGAISGTATINVVKWVDISSGSYAGWGYHLLTYSLAGYTGTIYGVHHSGSDERWGMVTGGIEGVVKFVGGEPKWYVTRIGGADPPSACAIIDFVTTNSIPGAALNTYSGVTLNIYSAVVSGSVTGYYNGSFQRPSITGLRLSHPAVQQADINFGPYQAVLEPA
jgi:hypothetical protein